MRLAEFILAGMKEILVDGSRTELTLEGNLHGHWDAPRLRQVLRSLLSNASAYGEPGKPVRVAVSGGSDAQTGN
ncbi:MAG: hypothetical protein JWM59_882 [Verrucomicrobiales bacterium]|nr:hypothetical protein [Verrucomicrobiales bacterium]